MRTSLTPALIILITAFACAACSSARVEPFVSDPTAVGPVADDSGREMFYDDLTPYGEWTWIAGPGWVWSPYAVHAGWRPYTLGHWVFTDHGWTWVSDEEFGWAVYHYGRWHNDAAHGWVWVPGLEWGPAWVAWHSGGGWVGWAPLPWQVRWSAETGLDRGHASVPIDPSWFCFTETRHLANPAVARHLAPAARNVTLVRTTTNITNYTYIDNRIVSSSVSVEVVGKAAGRPVPRYRIREAESSDEKHASVHGGDLVIHRAGAARSGASRKSAATGTVHGSRPASTHRPGPGKAPESAGTSVPSRSQETHRAREPRVAPPARGSHPPQGPPPSGGKPATAVQGESPSAAPEARTAHTKDSPPAKHDATPAAATPGKSGGENPQGKSKSSKSKAEKPKAGESSDQKKEDPGRSGDERPKGEGS
jgi:hypothetical protein